MSGSLLNFSVVYVRNIVKTYDLWTADMDYLRSRISTNRSMVSDRLSLAASRLYEGAKTLVDMLALLRLLEHRFILNEVHVEIDDDISYPHAMLTAILRTFRSDDHPLGPIVLRFIYTNVGQKNNLGGFIITLSATTGATLPHRSGIGDTVIRDYFGNVSAMDKYVDQSKPYCYKAGQSLRYSENFPTPSAFVADVDTLLADATEYLAAPITVTLKEDAVNA